MSTSADPAEAEPPQSLVIYEMARSPKPYHIMMEGLEAANEAERLERGWLMSSAHSGSIRALFNTKQIYLKSGCIQRAKATMCDRGGPKQLF